VFLESFGYIVERLFFDVSFLEVGSREQLARRSVSQTYVVYFQQVSLIAVQEPFIRSQFALEA
jgi:hypothetical protein